MGAFVNTALRALRSIAVLTVIAGCGSITVAEADGGSPAGAAAGGSGGRPDPAGKAAGPGTGGKGGAPEMGGPGGGGPATGCATDKDCRDDKLKRCDPARGVCVACLTTGDCDGDRTCVAGTCARGSG